jgi:hypothetical protein
MPEAIEPPAAPHEDAMTDAESEAFAEAAETFLQTSPASSARPAPACARGARPGGAGLRRAGCDRDREHPR